MVFQTKLTNHTRDHTLDKTLAFNMRSYSLALWTVINCSAGVFGDIRQQDTIVSPESVKAYYFLRSYTVWEVGGKKKRLLAGIITFYRCFAFISKTKLPSILLLLLRRYTSGKMENNMLLPQGWQTFK